MAESAIAANFLQSADVAHDLASQVAFHLVLAVQELAKTADLGFGQISNLGPWIDLRLFEQLNNIVLPDSIQDRQGVQNSLVAREINTCYTCHVSCLISLGGSVAMVATSPPIGSSLSLLVLGHLANHAQNTISFDDLALIANLLNTCPNFHGSFALCSSSSFVGSSKRIARHSQRHAVLTRKGSIPAPFLLWLAFLHHKGVMFGFEWRERSMYPHFEVPRGNMNSSAVVAQRIERLPPEQKVGGSSPLGRATF